MGRRMEDAQFKQKIATTNQSMHNQIYRNAK